MQDDLIAPRPTDLQLDDRWLELYIAGECTLAERAAIERWLSANPEQGRVIRTMRIGGMSEAFGADSDIDVPAAVHTLCERAGLLPDLPTQHEQPSFLNTALPTVNRSSGRRRTFLADWFGKDTSMDGNDVSRLSRRAIQSAVIALVGSVTAIGLALFPMVTSRLSSSGAGSAMSTYSTGSGERATVRLPDGSIVMLNVASQLEVPANYLDGNRALRLSGEALFQVVSRSNAPFTVNAGGTETRVLGTRFFVRRYGTDSVTTVGVHDGKVSVAGAVLTASQRAVVRRSELPIISSMPASQRTFADGVLVLDGMMLSDAITDLNRWYNVDIRLGDPMLATQRLRGELEMGAAEDLVEVLKVTLGVRVVREGRVLIIYPRQGK